MHAPDRRAPVRRTGRYCLLRLDSTKYQTRSAMSAMGSSRTNEIKAMWTKAIMLLAHAPQLADETLEPRAVIGRPRDHENRVVTG